MPLPYEVCEKVGRDTGTAGVCQRKESMRKILSYAKSHIYELHAMVVAVIVIALMSVIKVPVKRKIVQAVDKKIREKPELAHKRKLMIKRRNIVLIVMTMLLAIVVFAFVAVVSPFIEFSFLMAVMSGVFALCGYAFLEQITFGIVKGANK